MKLHRLSLLNLLTLLALPMPVPAQTLLEGKIFTSPEQRQYLDYLRKDYLAKKKQAGFDIDDSTIPEIPANAPNAPQGPVEYSLDGIMTRANGRVTIWLNHRPMTEQELPANFHLVREGNTPALKVVTADGRTVLLRPGQIMDVTSGVLQERLHKPAPVADQKAIEKAGGELASDPKLNSAAIENKPAEATKKSADKPAASTATEQAPVTGSPLQNPPSMIETLSKALGKDPKALESMIETLQTLREGLDEKAEP